MNRFLLPLIFILSSCTSLPPYNPQDANLQNSTQLQMAHSEAYRICYQAMTNLDIIPTSQATPDTLLIKGKTRFSPGELRAGQLVGVYLKEENGTTTVWIMTGSNLSLNPFDEEKIYKLLDEIRKLSKEVKSKPSSTPKAKDQQEFLR